MEEPGAVSLVTRYHASLVEAPEPAVPEGFAVPPTADQQDRVVALLPCIASGAIT